MLKDDIQGIELSSPMLSPEAELKPDVASIISKMSEEITRDSLTGAYNRRYIEEKLMIDVLHAYAENRPLSIILADIDCFKAVNDRYGHLAGDQVLRDFVQLSQGSVRKNGDWVARYGGDEFLIVLSDADENATVRIAEKIRKAAEATPVHLGNDRISYTVSIGTFTVHSRQTTSLEFIGGADKNLYMAKKAGRNRIISGVGVTCAGNIIPHQPEYPITK
jgi:diguanylate cyclase (GGDEF)-like protein